MLRTWRRAGLHRYPNPKNRRQPRLALNSHFAAQRLGQFASAKQVAVAVRSRIEIMLDLRFSEPAACASNFENDLEFPSPLDCRKNGKLDSAAAGQVGGREQQVFKHVPEPMGIAGHFVGQRRIHQAKNCRPPLRLGIGYKVDRLLDQGSEGELDSLDAEFFEFHAQNLGLSIVSANSTKWGSIPPNFRGS